MKYVGFTGSRSLDINAPDIPNIAAIVRHVLSEGYQVAVGDATGADWIVRRYAPDALVFCKDAYDGPMAAKLAQRSTAMVRHVVAHGGYIIGFPTAPCPKGLRPSPNPARCFAGFGSGTWATLALAAGLGLPVYVVRRYLGGFYTASHWAGDWSMYPAGPLGEQGALLYRQPVQTSIFLPDEVRP